MPKLYVANCTMHKHDFLFRVPEETRLVRHQIDPGQQVHVYGRDLTTDLIEYIVAQHEPYGMIPVSEVDRRKGAVSLVYSIDKPLNVEAIIRAGKALDKHLEEQALESRKDALAATHMALGQTADGRGPAGVELEIIEENKKGEDKDTSHETIQSAHEGSRAAQKQGSKRDNKRARR